MMKRRCVKSETLVGRKNPSSHVGRRGAFG
jgi:hypothetical protein